LDIGRIEGKAMEKGVLRKNTESLMGGGKSLLRGKVIVSKMRQNISNSRMNAVNGSTKRHYFGGYF